jgi:hypothetical protein
MAKKNRSNQNKPSYPIGKSGAQEEKKEEDFYRKHKSTIWTIIVLIILTFFFIVNNTRKVPAEGPYPPNYNNGNDTTETQ